jgi:hypothetical protein
VDVTARGWVGVTLVALMALAGCGDDTGGSDLGGDGDGVTTTTSTVDEPTTTVAAGGPELPEADPSSYVGQNRVVHLAVLPDGSTPTVDVWAKRSFEYAPILLVEGLEYGEVSDWYGRPSGMAVGVFAAGAGPDSEPIADLFSADDQQRYTHLVMFDRERDAASGFLLEDEDPNSSQAFPDAEPGTALVQLYAFQLRLNPLSEGESFDQTIAGVPTSFNVGMVGVEGCAPQPRATDQGFSPAVLGGTQRVAFDLQPGTTSFTFHGWGSDMQDCADPTKFGPVNVTVQGGDRAWVLIHSPDGETIDSLVVPLD